MQLDLQKVLSVSGYPGLFKFISQARQGIVVESLIDKRRLCLPSTAKVSSLGDITIFTESDDMLLKDVFKKIKEKENGAASISPKSKPEELLRYFGSVVPEFDKEKVFPSHIKKIIDWYNILQKNDLLHFETEETSTEVDQETNTDKS